MRTRPGHLGQAGIGLEGTSARSSVGSAPVARTQVQQRGGFRAFDAFARTLVPRGGLGFAPAAKYVAPPSESFAPPAPGEDPFRGLEDLPLIRAMRSAAESKKRKIDYPEVRRLIFTQIDNIGGQVTCAYTGRVRKGTDLPSPDDMNIEHCWPQSRGAKGAAKCDMNHLLPADTEANSKRGNVKFGIVTQPKWTKGGSVLGEDATGEMVFTPRPEVRGNVARNIFYFATVYGFAIDPKEEAVLRAWAQEDPVDAAEVDRTRAIEKAQGNPNYYVLFPQLLQRIRVFPKVPEARLAMLASPTDQASEAAKGD